jgi:hypothetical protein
VRRLPQARAQQPQSRSGRQASEEAVTTTAKAIEKRRERKRKMARSKRDKRVIVNEAYFYLIERKAFLLDEMTSESEGGVTVMPHMHKELSKLQAAYDKLDIGVDVREAYVEPKPPKT